MNNPNYPHRKICHADLLTKAGFKIDMAWYEIQPVKPIMVTNCGKLIYWKRGETHMYEFLQFTGLTDSKGKEVWEGDFENYLTLDEFRINIREWYKT